MSKIDVVVIGRITLDFNPTDGFNPLDKSVTFNKYIGGSAGNTAIGLARQGISVGLISRVSNDQFGKAIIDYLKKEKMTTKYIQVDKNKKTGLTFTEFFSDKKSTILMYRDEVADLEIDINQIDVNVIKNAKILVISGSSLAKSPAREAIFYAIEIARQHQVKIIFDLDYRPYTWKNELELATTYYQVAQNSEIIIGSKAEFALMKPLTGTDKSEELAKIFLNLSGKTIIIKDGANGSICFQNQKKFNVEIYPASLKKAFGGGDAYASCIIAGEVLGESIIDSLNAASAHASLVVSSHSCSDALKSRKEITEYVQNSGLVTEDIVKEQIWLENN